MKVFFRLKDIDDIQAEMGWKGGELAAQGYILDKNKNILTEINDWLQQQEHGSLMSLKPKLNWETDMYSFTTKCSVTFDMTEELAMLFKLRFGNSV